MKGEDNNETRQDKIRQKEKKRRKKKRCYIRNHTSIKTSKTITTNGFLKAMTNPLKLRACRFWGCNFFSFRWSKIYGRVDLQSDLKRKKFNKKKKTMSTCALKNLEGIKWVTNSDLGCSSGRTSHNILPNVPPTLCFAHSCRQRPRNSLFFKATCGIARACAPSSGSNCSTPPF